MIKNLNSYHGLRINQSGLVKQPTTSAQDITNTSKRTKRKTVAAIIATSSKLVKNSTIVSA